MMDDGTVKYTLPSEIRQGLAQLIEEYVATCDPNIWKHVKGEPDFMQDTPTLQGFAKWLKGEIK